MRTFTVNSSTKHGISKRIFVFETNRLLRWYCVENEREVTATRSEILEGVNIEKDVFDLKSYINDTPITSEDELLISVIG